MKKICILIITLAFGLSESVKTQAQYTSIVNQAADILQAAAIGGFNYKGYVEGSYTGGFGNLRANFAGISTSQGFKYANWFFMGAGLGVDLVFSETETRYSGDRDTRTCGVMIPIFTDFRFNIGSDNSPAFYIDVKAGGSFLIGRDYLAINNGYINGNEYFYLKPSLGIRIPTSENGKTAFNVGVTYQLLTCNYWFGRNSSGTLNSLGATVGYSW